MDAVEEFNDVFGVSIRFRFQSRRPIHPDAKTKLGMIQSHSKLYQYIQSLFDSQSAKQIRAIFRNRRNQWLHPSGLQSGATSVLCIFFLHIASKNPPLRRTILFLFFDALFFHCDVYGESDVSCRMQTFQSVLSFHEMKCFVRWEALISFFKRLLRLSTDSMAIFQEWMKTSSAGRASNCVFAHLSGVEQLLNEYTHSTAIYGGPLQLEIIQCFLQFILECELLPQCKPLQQVNACINDRLYQWFFSKFQCIATIDFNSVWRQSLFKLMERTSVLYQHQRVSDVNVAAVFVLGIKTISEQTFLNLYDGWFKICKSVALNHENGGLERYKTHLLVLVGISAHCQTMDVKRVLELLLEMTSFIRRNTSYLYETQFVLFLIVYLAVCSQTSLNTLKPDAKLLLQEFRLQFLSVLVPQQSHLYRCFQSHSVFTLKSKKELWRKWFDIEHQEDLNRNWSSGDIEDALAFRRQFKAISSCIPLQSLQQWPHMKAFLSTQHQPPSCRLLTTKKKLILLMQPPPHIEETPAQRMSEMLPDELLMRIFLFLSAKRLCRIASVNKQCHELICGTKVWTQNVWKALYFRSTFCGSVLTGRTRCPHGPLFHHQWAQMYQDRFLAMRKMMRRRVKRDSCSLRMCLVCGCHRILKSIELDSHLALHAKYTCTLPLCNATFLAKTALLTHQRNHTKKRKRGGT